MKRKHKGLKILGAIAGIGTICCIIPACVVSCGSSNNSSASNQPNIPTSLVGTTTSKVATNWDATYHTYSTTNTYGNWMKNNVENYVQNAATYWET